MLRNTLRSLRFALPGASAVALILVAVGGAANGGTFILGQANSATATTSLSGSTAGPQLKVANTNTSNHAIEAQAGGGAGIALYAQHTTMAGAGPALRGDSASTAANAFSIYGLLTATSPAGANAAVRGENKATNGLGYGVWGSQAGTGVGVYGQSPGGPGVFGKSTSWNGVQGFASASGVSGVYGQNLNGGYGTAGRASGAFAGALGDNLGSGPGVSGSSVSGDGVVGASTGGFGVHGSTTKAGMAGVAGVDAHTGGTGVPSGIGVWGSTSSASGYGVYGAGPTYGVVGASGNSNGDAGFFQGAVVIQGTLYVNGCVGCSGPALRIDDPASPARDYLQHSSVASPDMIDLYDGIATTDARGFASVSLPSYFQALNRSFRYQLTVIGKAHWDAKAAVWNEIAHNRFTIRTDEPNVKVSWQVTGIRHDPYSNAHRVQVVLPKTGAEQGKFLHPELFGKPKSEGIGYRKAPKLPSLPSTKP